MIIFLYGPDSYRSREKLKNLKNKFINEIDQSGDSITVMDGEKISLEKLNEYYAASSLFSSKRMVVVENISLNKSLNIQNSILDYIKQREDDENIIIFWDETAGEKMGKNKLFNYLSKLKFAEKFNNLNDAELKKWIKDEAAEAGLSVDNQAISILMAYFEKNMWQLKNEINKLIHFKLAGAKDGDKIINKNDVNNICRGKTDENIFALTDAISNKDKALALELFEKELEKGVSGEYLLYMISRQFKILLQLKDALESGMTINEIKKQFKMHPYVIQKALQQAKNFNFQILKSLNEGLIRVEKAIKSGKADVSLALSVIISRI